MCGSNSDFLKIEFIFLIMDHEYIKRSAVKSSGFVIGQLQKAIIINNQWMAFNLSTFTG